MADERRLKLGTYELLERIGTGGMAEVFRARQQQAFDREVAVKVIRRGFAQDGLFRQRFLREGQATARLSHPHILPLIELGQAGRGGKTLFLVMPYVRGGTLRDLLERVGGLLPLELTAHIFVQLCAAVQYAHDHGLVHRDIKPSNILLQTEQHILLADFGIALDTEDARLTSTGLGMGTAEYTAPEQARGFADFRSDLYALGVVLFELLTGHVPFLGRTPFEILFKHTTAPAPLLREVAPALPEGYNRLEPVLQRALAKDPARRFQSAADLSAAFRAALMQDIGSAVVAPAQAVGTQATQPPAAAAATPAAPGMAVSGAALADALTGPVSLAPPTADHPARERWSPPYGFFPLPVAPVEGENIPGGDPEALLTTPGDDPAGERPTTLATAARFRGPSLARFSRQPRRRLVVFLLVLLLGGGLVVGSGTFLLASLWLSSHGSGAPLTVQAPTATTLSQRTPTSQPTTVPRATPTSTPEPTATLSPSPTPTTNPSPTAAPTQLGVTPTALIFSLTVSACLVSPPQQTLTVQNNGGGTLNWQSSVQNPVYLALTPTSGKLGAGASTAVTVTLLCPATPTQTTETIHFTSNGGAVDVVVTISVS